MFEQRRLDLRGEQLRTLWRKLPERHQREASTILARLIAAAAQNVLTKKRKRR